MASPLQDYEYVETQEMLLKRQLRCVWSVTYIKPKRGSATVIQEGPRIPKTGAKEDQWGVRLSTGGAHDDSGGYPVFRVSMERGQSLSTRSIFKVEVRNSKLDRILWSHYDYAIKLDATMPQSCAHNLETLTRARLSIIWEVGELDLELHKQLDNKQNRVFSLWRESTSDSKYAVKIANKDIPCSVEALKSSPVFEKMIESDMREKQTGVIDLTDVLDTDTAEDLVSFLSTGIALNIRNTCLNLLKAADLYNVEELKGLCQIELVKSLKADNVAQLLQVAYQYGAKWLQKHSVLFIKANFQDVCLTEGWKSVDEMTRVVAEEFVME